MITSYGIATPPSTQLNHIVYLSPPLKKDLIVYGPVSFTLYASTTEKVTSDWSFFVKLGEMVPKGIPLNPVTGLPEMKPEVNDISTPENVQIWSWGSLKAKFREVDKSLSLTGMPWHTFSNPQRLSPGTVYEFQIELQPVFKTFKKGRQTLVKNSQRRCTLFYTR